MNIDEEYNEYYNKYYQSTVYKARRYGVPDLYAEDCASECMAVLWKSRYKLRGDAKFGAFAYRVIANSILVYRRKHKRHWYDRKYDLQSEDGDWNNTHDRELSNQSTNSNTTMTVLPIYEARAELRGILSLLSPLAAKTILARAAGYEISELLELGSTRSARINNIYRLKQFIKEKCGYEVSSRSDRSQKKLPSIFT